MKKLIICVALLCLSNFSTADESCFIKPENETLYKLAKEVDAACGWTIQKIAAESILKKCQEANPNTGDTLRFSDFSYSYDTNVPFYYCKNKKGYEAHLAQLVKTLKNEVNENERKNHAEKDLARAKECMKSGSNCPKPSSPSAVNSEKKKKWICTVPGYITRTVEVDESRIEGYRQAYDCVAI